MADKLITLLDMTKRAGTDQAVGLIEEVNTVAPELTQLGGTPLNGITYKLRKRTVLPRGGSTVFRNANEGSDLSASTYEQAVGSCYFLDIPMAIDESVAEAGVSEGSSLAQILAEEAAGAFAQALNGAGDQFYRGTTADAKGFAGMYAQYDATNCLVTAGGGTGTYTSAWLIWNSVQGVRWRWGNGSGIRTGEWQRLPRQDSSSKTFYAYHNNVRGWVGLQVGHSRSIVRIKLIDTNGTKPLTDALVAEALSKMPIFIRQDRANLRLLCNSVAALGLQKSRSATTNSSSTPLQFAPQPTESNGVPIILTDSILNTETA